ncbi:MAG: hypothetical protein D6801_09030, partial [Alphaproteobacteria bacterium]
MSLIWAYLPLHPQQPAAGRRFPQGYPKGAGAGNSEDHMRYAATYDLMESIRVTNQWLGASAAAFGSYPAMAA